LAVLVTVLKLSFVVSLSFTIPLATRFSETMADVEKAGYEVDAAARDSDQEVRKGSITEAADIYGDIETAEREDHDAL
jgi:hypothetical protein